MVTVAADDDVVAALSEPELIPPPAGVGATGATMALRGAMARFAAPEAHPEPRRAVEALLGAIDADAVAERAAHRTARHLAGPSVDVAASIAPVVPVEAMLETLGVDIGLVADVDAVVAVIGRGEPPTDRSDAAAARLQLAAVTAGHDPVAAVSVLYQTMDATAALVLCRMFAAVDGGEMVPPVPRTRRIARRAAVVGDHRVEGGTEIDIELATRPFGAGPHQCPGREVAERIAAAVVASITDAGYVVDVPSVELDADRRPRRLAVRRASGD